MDKIEKLMKLKELFESGVITKEELDAEKSKLLSSTEQGNQTESGTTQEFKAEPKTIKEQPDEHIQPQPRTLTSKGSRGEWIGPIIFGSIILVVGALLLAPYVSKKQQPVVEDTYVPNTNSSGHQVMTADEYIMNSATDLMSLTSAIWANELRAKSTYLGKNIIAKLTATSIDSGDDGYRFTVSCESDRYRINGEGRTLYFYLKTSNTAFYYLDYPCTIYVQGNISDIYESYLGYHVELTNVTPLMAYQNGNYEVYNMPSNDTYGTHPGGLDDDGRGPDEIF